MTASLVLFVFAGAARLIVALAAELQSGLDKALVGRRGGGLFPGLGFVLGGLQGLPPEDVAALHTQSPCPVRKKPVRLLKIVVYGYYNIPMCGL